MKHFYRWTDPWPRTVDDPEHGAGGPNDQQRLAAGMLDPGNLLDLIRTFTLFSVNDKGETIKIVGRYQRFRAVKRAVKRLLEGRSPRTRSGIVRHTQGSGKSLTMMFMVREMYRHATCGLPTHRHGKERLMSARAHLFGLAFLLGAGEARAAAVCSNTPGAGDTVECTVASGVTQDIDIDLASPAVATSAAQETAVFADHQGTGGVDVDVAGGTVSAAGENGQGVWARHRGGSGGVSITLDEAVEVTAAYHGVHASIDDTANAATITISVTGGSLSTTDANIGGAGVWTLHQGRGGIDVHLSAVTVSTKGLGDGVYARHTGAGGGGVDVTVAGASISTEGADAHGVGGDVRGDSEGAVDIDVTGVAITATGPGSHGVYGLARNAAGEAVSISVTGGTIETSGLRGNGIHGQVFHSGSGAAISIDTRDVAITARGRDASGVEASHGGTGGIDVDLRGGSISTTNDFGFAVNAQRSGAGVTEIDLEDVVVKTAGAIAYGVYARHTAASGRVSINLKDGTSVTATGSRAHGITGWASRAEGELDVLIDVQGGARIKTAGERAYGILGLNEGLGGVSITLPDARIETTGDVGRGVYGLIRNSASAADVSVGMAGGSITVEGLGTRGLLGIHEVLGSVRMTTGPGAVIEAPFAVGADGSLTNDANATGRVVLEKGGTIEARDTGILAQAARSSGSTFGEGTQTADDAARAKPMIHVTSSGTVTVGAGVMDDFIRNRITGADGTLSAAERAVLDAVTAGDSDALDAALAALPASYTDDYEAEARNLLRKRGWAPTDAADRSNQAAEGILGLSRAGVRALALSHTAIADSIRNGDQDPAILAIDEASRTEEQEATLEEQAILGRRADASRSRPDGRRPGARPRRASGPLHGRLEGRDPAARGDLQRRRRPGGRDGRDGHRRGERRGGALRGPA